MGRPKINQKSFATKSTKEACISFQRQRNHGVNGHPGMQYAIPAAKVEDSVRSTFCQFENIHVLYSNPGKRESQVFGILSSLFPRAVSSRSRLGYPDACRP